MSDVRWKLELRIVCTLSSNTIKQVSLTEVNNGMAQFSQDSYVFWWKFSIPLMKFLTFRYHLKEVIIGKIYFLFVRIKMKNMELEIRRRESTGSGPNTYVETETVAKFELVDGAPVRGEQSLLCDLFVLYHIDAVF